MDRTIEFDFPNSNQRAGAPALLDGRRATTLVVSDVGCDCSVGFTQALREDRDLAVLMRAPSESVDAFAQRIAARVRKMPFPVADAFVGPHRWGTEYGTLVRRLAGCLPSGASLTMCADGPSERLRCQATADALEEIDHPLIAFCIASSENGPATSPSRVGRVHRAPPLKPLCRTVPCVDIRAATDEVGRPPDAAALVVEG